VRCRALVSVMTRRVVVLAAVVLVSTMCTRDGTETSRVSPSASGSVTNSSPTLTSDHLAAAPTDCADAGVLLLGHVRPWGQVLGSSPAWMYVGRSLDPSIGALHTPARLSEHGWTTKALWILPASASRSVTITGMNASTGDPIWFNPAGSTPGDAMTLDPAKPGAVPSTGDPWLEFPSTLSFPGAGCYTVSAHGAAGEWSTTFGFGR